jgi:hypothetical protein
MILPSTSEENPKVGFYYRRRYAALSGYAKGKYHRVVDVPVSRANRPIGIWTACGKNMPLHTDAKVPSYLERDLPEDETYVSRYCRICWSSKK